MKKLISFLVILLLLVGCSQPSGSENAVYTFDGKEVTAREYYDKLYETYGISYVYLLLENTVLQDETLSEANAKKVQEQYDSLIKNYGTDEGITYLDALIRSSGLSGYDDLKKYIEIGYKKQAAIDAYIKDQYNDPAFFSAKKPRLVQHILVFAEKDGSLSSTAKSAVESIDAALANATNFESAVKGLSDSNTILYEDLGYVDSDTKFETPFLDVALALEEGATSGWIQTTYGYHRIYILSTDEAKVREYDGFYDSVGVYDTSVQAKAMWNLFKTKGVEFDSDFESKIKTYLNIKED